MTAVSASWPLQVAVFTALRAAVQPVPVYDAVPQDATFPYAVVGDDSSVDWPVSLDADGEDIDVTIHLWSRYAGSKEVKELMGKVRAALHDRALPLVAGLSLVSFRCTSERSFTEPDGKTRHGVIRFRALIASDPD